MKKIDEQTKKDIIELHIKKGLYPYEISEILNVSRPIIYDVIKKYKEDNNLDFVIGTIMKRKNVEQNTLHLPKELLEDINFDKEDKRVCLVVDKNNEKRQIIIRKPEK